MNRHITDELHDHFRDHRQMAFLSGPRQIGKTTIARRLSKRYGTSDSYLNWDNQDHRAVILSGPGQIVSRLDE